MLDASGSVMGGVHWAAASVGPTARTTKAENKPDINNT